MDLTFKLTDCVTTFTAFDKYRRNEVSFKAKPKSFAITTADAVVIGEETDANKDGAQIELVIIADEFDDGAHGFITALSGWGLNIALACTQQQMAELNNFIVNEKKPNQIEITIANEELVSRNFKMKDEQYKITGWKFKI